ncbi:acyl--CoA ligase [Streptomyces filamentosus]|uniref:Acyl--CoA ligase n=3 Tax=Streptomyces TaxID=1883 RepID=A0ABY4UY32_STRFL|nr:class I adenylate-forming enzyme family protein [Streptomyces filamentosus]EFE75309.1 AMP-dependent synthetase and ligase [Streptomyces filamentosus NRRL 15998]EWS92362.1 dicarboxylate-CoA ligase PimA [Streptomyces filamentosus NRRL 11379]MYR79380.1 AMP-binding protein [Streptomyces sp. SID5466]USC49044.1 acyl--CoA ligase [Streptomyces filamentosus]
MPQHTHPSPPPAEDAAARAERARRAARIEDSLTAPGAPFAVVRGEQGALEYADGPRTLREFVETTWAYGDTPFLIAGERTYTYGEFFAAASALAVRLRERYGLRSGDRAVIAMRNHPEWQIAFWAAQLAGLVAVPLNAWWTEDEFVHALDDCEPGVLLVDGERLGRVAGWARRTGAYVVLFHGAGRTAEGLRLDRYDDFPAPDPLAAPPDVDPRPEDDATIIYTSGTTGRPKGAVATHLAQAGAALNPRYQAAASALGRGAVPGMGPAPVSLMTFPFFHVAAFTSFYGVMAAGGTLVLMDKWDADEALRLIRARGVTHFAGVPTTALQLLDAAERTGDGLASLTLFSTGGAAPPPALVARLTARYDRRVEPRNGYGLTETSGGVLAHFGDDYRADPAGAGRPTPVTEVRIAGPSGEELPDGETGELWLRGQSLFRGYWRDAAATEEAFGAGGWFRTGDLAVRREGQVSVVDRLKDVVIRGGENVYCVEVEGVLHDHPDVSDAAVLGLPHPVLGEEVAAVVRLRAGATVTAGALREHVGGRLAAFKVPARVLFTDEPLPRNATGKLLKPRLRALAEAAGPLTGTLSGPPARPLTGA